MVAEIAGIAAIPGTITDRARALLEPLRRITHYDGAFITLFDAEQRRHVPLARQGFDAAQSYLDSPALVTDLERLDLHGSRRPLRVSDLAPLPNELPLWADYLYPAGFREGLGSGLFTADGRFLGLFTVNTADPRPASEDTCALLHLVMPLIAHAVDPLRNLTVLASLVTDAIAGVVVSHGGGTTVLPGLPEHALLAPGRPVVLAALVRLANRQVRTAFLCRNDDSDPSAPPLLRVTALACPPQPANRLRMVVLLSPPPSLNGLTTRELQVLGLLVEGRSNAHIAATLHVTTRTAVGHIDHIMVKLETSSRAVAAMRAQRQGLFIPAELGPSTPSTANTRW
ncbi:LuxR C-terminal-related transcriptional regulator [Actinoplanes sp. NPDC051346]|uniref:LuxR C-terminal-related transcriptional regulator n=1 Tax=Actinoplanes sp. NPDC051346 TaxID=3155048 RepID=UPI00341AE826